MKTKLNYPRLEGEGFCNTVSTEVDFKKNSLYRGNTSKPKCS